MKNFTPMKRFLTLLILLVSFFEINAQTITQTFNSSGTFTVPAGVTQLTVEAWGGGGRGGNTSGFTGATGGGGGGAYSRRVIPVTPGATYTVTVGLGATPTSLASDSWFSTNTTILAKAGSSCATNSATGAAGGSATAGIGDVKFSGGNGANAVTILGVVNSGGGGSSAGTAANGQNATSSIGGTAPAGGGNGANGLVGVTGNGNNGVVPGGGGSGSSRLTAGTSNGGSGANGRVIVTYFLPEIDIQGNSTSIVDGDTTPSLSDWTDFDTTVIGTPITRTFTIFNTGTGSLNLGAITFSGTNASEFTVTSAPSAVVAPSGSTTFTVSFNPTAVGLRTATFSIVTNDQDENPYNFNIQGNATSAANPLIFVQGNGINIPNGSSSFSVSNNTDFGSINIGAGTITRTFTILNSGSATLNLWSISSNNSSFVVSSSSSTIAPGGNATLTVVFTPNTPGINTATLTISNDDLTNNPFSFMVQANVPFQEINLQGNGNNIATGSTAISSTINTDFGSTDVASGSVTRTYTIQNLGGSPLDIYSVYTNHGDFVASVSPNTIPAGGTATLTVVFNPSSLGTINAIVSISSNDTDEATYTFSVAGIGTEQEIEVTGNTININDGDTLPSTADWTDFGTTSVGGAINRTFTIRNTGSSNLTLGAITFSGTDASNFTVLTAPSATVAPGASTTVVVRFSPTAAGLRTATISIVNNDSNENPFDFAIQGNGTASSGAVIEVRGAGFVVVNGSTSPSLSNLTDFNSTNESSGTITKVFVISNLSSSTNLTISSVTISGANAADFTVTRAAGTTITPGNSTTLEITFNPSALGVRNASVSIANNDATKNPYTFSITGRGTSFATQSHTIYYENFDNNNGGWVSSGTTGSWTYDNTIHVGEGNFWRVTTSSGNYTNSNLTYITSPTLSTSNFRNVKLYIDTRFDTSNDLNDGMQLQYSIDNGTTWFVLGTNTQQWYNSTSVASLSTSLGSTFGWNGNNSTATGTISRFDERSIQYSLLDNVTSLRLRAVFTSNGSTVDTGCAIDNIILKGDPIVAFTDPAIGPGSVNNNLKLWLKSNAGTSTTIDGTALASWNDQAFNNHAVGINGRNPIFRDNITNNVNYNSVVDFNSTASQLMKGKGGFWSQDYYVVIKTNNQINNTETTLGVPISGRVSINQFNLDGTAFGLGSFTARYVDEMVSHNINSIQGTPSNNSYGRAYVSTTDNYDQETIIFNVKTSASGTVTEIYKNGQRIDNTTGVAQDGGTLNFSEFQNLQYNLGVGRFTLGGHSFNSHLNGRLTEIISYSNPKSALEQHKIQSYLAIKNGITLHDINSVTAYNLNDVNYIDSNGNVIWNTSANTGFNYDIAGIGRDDNTLLNQKQSKSENQGTVLTIGLGDVLNTNSANPNTFTTDKSFLVWGSNGESMINSGININVDLGPSTITTITEVVNRKWKLVETGGDIGTTRVSVPTSSFISGLPALSPTDAYVMVVANDENFTTGIETVFLTTNGANQTCLYDFDGTKYITFGVAHQAVNSLHITLDGNDDFVRIGDVNQIGATFTIMTWVRPTGNNNTNTERTILSKKANATSGYQVVLQNDNRVRIEWIVAGTTYSAITNTAIPNLMWHNIAITYGSNTLRMYIDGVLDRTATINVAPATSTSSFSIGAQYRDKNNIINLWRGDIDELRMWNRVLSETEIRFIMNQEIVQNGTGTRGSVTPTTITKNDINTLLWNNLFAYYSMNSYIGTHLDDDSFNVNRGSLVIPDKISINPQTAPMPYRTGNDGLWSNTNSWLNGTIQDLPYSLSIIDGTTPIDWNIVRTSHNIESTGNKNLLGLFVDSNILTANNDSKLEISHYLRLNGVIDLNGRSQLVQVINSDLDPTSGGSLHRDQQGQNNIYNYNYWSSPVGAINNTTNNNTSTVSGNMKDGSTATPQNITWTSGLNGSPTTPITLSSYWIFKFQNLTNAYANWQSVGPNGALSPGIGYTLKGAGTATSQNYTYVGKPNNGNISVPISPSNLNLCGNPYASAIDANAFITANNTSTTGTLYFWEHYSTNNTHNLANYQGGYATRTLVGGTPPVAPPGVSGLGSSSKVPGRYIPVGQGFFVSGSAAGGTINFTNAQRTFVKEDHAQSNTMFRSNSILTINHFHDNKNDEVQNDSIQKIRLGFNERNGYHRQTLLGFMNENATSGIDVGYDAILLDNQPGDMWFINNGTNLIINGEGYFNENNIYPLGVKSDAIGTVSFTIDSIENFTQDINTYIYDAVTDTYHDIKNEPFAIEIPQGTITNRFSLRFINPNEALGTINFDDPNAIQVVFTSSNNTINIKNKLTDEIVDKVELFNLLGQSIGNWDVKNENQLDIQLPVKNISTATYIVKIKTTNGATSRKIIIN